MKLFKLCNKDINRLYCVLPQWPLNIYIFEYIHTFLDSTNNTVLFSVIKVIVHNCVLAFLKEFLFVIFGIYHHICILTGDFSGICWWEMTDLLEQEVYFSFWSVYRFIYDNMSYSDVIVVLKWLVVILLYKLIFFWQAFFWNLWFNKTLTSSLICIKV